MRLAKGTRLAAGLLLLLAFAPSAYAQGGQRVSKGDKVPLGTLVTGDCWDKTPPSGSPADTASTYVYILDENGFIERTVGGVFPTDCDPVEVDEVGDYRMMTAYYKCSPNCVSTQKDVEFEVVTPKPRQLAKRVTDLLNDHRTALNAQARIQKQAGDACHGRQWDKAEKLAAEGEDANRDVTDLAGDVKRAIRTLEDARGEIKKKKRQLFDQLIDALNKTLKVRTRVQKLTRQGTEAYGDRRCAAGDQKQAAAADLKDDWAATSRKVNELLSRVF